MKRLFTLLAVAVIIGMSSCSSSKKTTQSSDDMYYSTGTSKASAGQYVAAAPNDQYVQMRVQDPERWSYFDDYSAYDSYYSPAVSAGYGFGYPYPAYGFGYGYGMGFGPSFGLGFGDPFMMWNSYFIWNSWYNPYFYNPYYGGGALVVGHNPGAVYTNLRPFNTISNANVLAHNGVGTTSASRTALYRPGMTSTTAYNRGLSSNGRSTNSFRPANTNGNSFRSFQSTRSYSPSFGGSSGGGFRGGGVGRH